jgi:hypothetical protein
MAVQDKEKTFMDKMKAAGKDDVEKQLKRLQVCDLGRSRATRRDLALTEVLCDAGHGWRLNEG